MINNRTNDDRSCMKVMQQCQTGFLLLINYNIKFVFNIECMQGKRKMWVTHSNARCSLDESKYPKVTANPKCYCVCFFDSHSPKLLHCNRDGWRGVTLGSDVCLRHLIHFSFFFLFPLHFGSDSRAMERTLIASDG